MPKSPVRSAGAWLVTGGAGYIGAHVVRALRDDHDVVVLDDLSTGDPARLPAGAELYVGSVLDTDLLCDVLHDRLVRGVVHLAGVKAVPESIDRPLGYYEQNVHGMHSLLTAMVRVGVPRMVFSSSAAVYGQPPTDRVSELSPTDPVSPYGRTKLACEWMLRDTANAHHLSWVALRYFNVAGAAAPGLADRGTANLIPRIFSAVTSGATPEIFGTDHPTPDGTCVRDYVHVADLARAHAAMMRHLDTNQAGSVYNVGRGRGASVLQVMHAARRATGIDFRWEPRGARPGDAACVVADTRKISADLRWRARHDLDAIVSSAWNAWQASIPALHLPR